MNETSENRARLRSLLRLAMVAGLLALPIAAPAQFSFPKPPPPATTESLTADPYGRGTPRGCLFGFLQAAEKGNFQTAAAYLQIPPTLQGSRETIARKLQVVFDQRLVTRSLDLVSRKPEGSADDGLGPGMEKVEEVRTGTGTMDVVLVREEKPGQPPIWLVSWDTIRACVQLYDELQLPDIDRHMPPVLVRTRLAGMPIWKIGGLVLLLPVVYAVSWLFVSLVLALVRLLRRRRVAPGAHWWAPSAKSPATFLLTLLLHRLCVERLGVPALHRLFYNRIILLLLCVGLYWLLARVVDALDRSALARFVPAGTSARHATLTLARRALKLVAFILVVVVGLASFGVNLTATLAGLGIGGLVLAFAAQKSLENMFGGIAVLSDRALRVGDMCKIGGQQGEVEDITLWATRLRTLDRSVVSIPNGVVMGAQIENLSRRDKFWFRPTVGLVHETTADQMRQVLGGVRALLAADSRVDQSNPRVNLVRLGASSLDVEVSAYVRSVTQDDFLAVQEDLLLRILRIVEDAGTAVAFPAQTVYLAGGGRAVLEGGDARLRLSTRKLAAGALMAALAGGAFARGEPATSSSSGFERAVDAVFQGESGQPRFHLDAALESRPSFRLQDAAGAAAGEAEAPLRKPRWIWIGAGGAAAILGSAYNAFSEDDNLDFHVTHEGWFGRNTYAGGADKGSHFVSYYAVTRIMNEYNLALGASRDQAALLASGVAFLAGAATEIGDGTNRYGFSWEDLTMDTLGAATGLAILHYQLGDLIGFRYGLVPAPDQGTFGLGKDYSDEIYAGDLKIAGLGHRMDFNPGPARFLLLSTTYGVKGYPYSPPEVRQRQIGIELGINFEEVLKAVGVPRHKWWGVVLYTLFDIIRIPYTAWGFRYDLNGKTWYGPDTGDSFPGGQPQPGRGLP